MARLSAAGALQCTGSFVAYALVRAAFTLV
jgi:hypothetical protein